MNTAMSHVESLIAKAASTKDGADEAMKYSQAALNVAKALSELDSVARQPPK